MAEGRTIDDILKELLNNAKPILLRGVEKAVDIAVEDIYKFSISILERYYDNYEPSRYDRTNQLFRATVPIADVKNSGKTIMATVGVGYDPSVLNGIYDGSKKYGHPDGGWVLENYLMGIHPATNGSRNPDTVVYVPWQDSMSPDKLLNHYLQWYQNKFNDDVYSYLIKYITK